MACGLWKAALLLFALALAGAEAGASRAVKAEAAYQQQKSLRLNPSCAREQWLGRCSAPGATMLLVEGKNGGCLASGCYSIDGDFPQELEVLKEEEVDDAVLRAVASQQWRWLQWDFIRDFKLRIDHSSLRKEERRFKRAVKKELKPATDYERVVRYLEEAAEKGFGPEATGEAMACLSKRRAELQAAADEKRRLQDLEYQVVELTREASALREAAAFDSKMFHNSLQRLEVELSVAMESEYKAHGQTASLEVQVAGLEGSLSRCAAEAEAQVAGLEESRSRCAAETEACTSKIAAAEAEAVESRARLEDSLERETRMRLDNEGCQRTLEDANVAVAVGGERLAGFELRGRFLLEGFNTVRRRAAVEHQRCNTTMSALEGRLVGSQVEVGSLRGGLRGVEDALGASEQRAKSLEQTLRFQEELLDENGADLAECERRLRVGSRSAGLLSSVAAKANQPTEEGRQTPAVVPIGVFGSTAPFGSICVRYDELNAVQEELGSALENEIGRMEEEADETRTELASCAADLAAAVARSASLVDLLRVAVAEGKAAGGGGSMNGTGAPSADDGSFASGIDAVVPLPSEASCEASEALMANLDAVSRLVRKLSEAALGLGRRQQ